MSSTTTTLARLTGWACVSIGAVQLVGGARTEPGMSAEPTVDSHVRFMGPVFAGYGIGWLDAASAREPDLGRLRLLGGLMAIGGLGRLATRATTGRPHRFHDVLLAVELAMPLAVEVAARRDRAAR